MRFLVADVTVFMALAVAALIDDLIAGQFATGISWSRLAKHYVASTVLGILLAYKH